MKDGIMGRERRMEQLEGEGERGGSEGKSKRGREEKRGMTEKKRNRRREKREDREEEERRGEEEGGWIGEKRKCMQKKKRRIEDKEKKEESYGGEEEEKGGREAGGGKEGRGGEERGVRRRPTWPTLKSRVYFNFHQASLQKLHQRIENLIYRVCFRTAPICLECELKC